MERSRFESRSVKSSALNGLSPHSLSPLAEMLNKVRSYLPVLLVVALLFSQHAHGRPYRRKRTSDQRLAEIQTYLALSKMKGEIKNAPVAFGIVDLNHIGTVALPRQYRQLSQLFAPFEQDNSGTVALPRQYRQLSQLFAPFEQDNRGRRRRSLKHSLKDLMNSSRQESIADDVLANDANENLNDLLTRLDQDNRAEWQYDWDIYPSLEKRKKRCTPDEESCHDDLILDEHNIDVNNPYGM
uniref:Uncharacterized protein n=1 Tax=Timema cristinae TaxID=61476 RepID=A0A7R9GPE9_TIMCR|nr:unnamed protein product [Timema cristinae]